MALAISDNNKAPHNLSRGSDTVFTGATHVFAVSKFTTTADPASTRTSLAQRLLRALLTCLLASDATLGGHPPSAISSQRLLSAEVCRLIDGLAGGDRGSGHDVILATLGGRAAGPSADGHTQGPFSQNSGSPPSRLAGNGDGVSTHGGGGGGGVSAPCRGAWNGRGACGGDGGGGGGVAARRGDGGGGGGGGVAARGGDGGGGGGAAARGGDGSGGGCDSDSGGDGGGGACGGGCSIGPGRAQIAASSASASSSRFCHSLAAAAARATARCANIRRTTSARVAKIRFASSGRPDGAASPNRIRPNPAAALLIRRNAIRAFAARRG
ncbi:uncharacterized PE-PGRS family protein PE_PGRS24-like [Drosophila rhopaloa]|uniref:Uncharacterized protein n=1 Tax=Drosophila rhopaloa TaxID=1041015 RepID=A0ABM5J663_DRORH|nr:uncharacterized PE-PGRS family protein PE_PGRS24-like [Drosophila rhopaloa]